MSTSIESNSPPPLIMGCVSYDPAVGEIWSGIQEYLIQDCNVPFRYVLFDSYEGMVDALVKTQTIDIAWNGPVAHVMTEQMVSTAAVADDGSGGGGAQKVVVSLGMRDVDCDFQSIVIGRKDCKITSLEQLKDISTQGLLRLLTGTQDSPQANIVPAYYLTNELGLQFATTTHFDVDMGKHGDTAIGEIQAMEALLTNSNDKSTTNEMGGGNGYVDIVILSRMMWDRGLKGSYVSSYNIDPDRLLDTCEELTFINIPPFDHCQFDAIINHKSNVEEDCHDDDGKLSRLNNFGRALLGMSWDNPKQQHLMKLEGIQKEWKLPRQEGYDIVRKAVLAMNSTSSSTTTTLADHRVATNFDYKDK